MDQQFVCLFKNVCDDDDERILQLSGFQVEFE